MLELQILKLFVNLVAILKLKHTIQYFFQPHKTNY